MAKNLFLIFTIVLSVLIFSCDKFPATENNQVTKLKKIIGAQDTVYPLCSPTCPPSIWRNEEEFIYDGSNRLIRRIVIKRNIAPGPEITDTISVFKYSYNDNSAIIYSYSEKTAYSNVEFMHELMYDSQYRLLKDSITNPQPNDNNKVTRFTYLQDTIIQWGKQHFIAGDEIIIDTMTISGNNVAREKIRGFTKRDFIYTVSNYINPLSYANNFSLLASDRKNGSNSTLFMIYTPQYITYNMTSQIEIITSSTTSISTFDIIVDSLDRVKSFTESSNRNKMTSFEYY